MLVKFISCNYLNITQESLQMNKRIGIFFFYKKCINGLLLHSKMQAGNFSMKKKSFILKMYIIVHNLFIRFVFYSSWTLSWCRRLRYNFICKFSFIRVILFFQQFFFTFMPYRYCIYAFKWNKINVKIFSSYPSFGTMLFYYSNFSNILSKYYALFRDSRKTMLNASDGFYSITWQITIFSSPKYAEAVFSNRNVDTQNCWCYSTYKKN